MSWLFPTAWGQHGPLVSRRDSLATLMYRLGQSAAMSRKFRM